MGERSGTILIAIVQGLLLLAAHEALARGLWPATLAPVVVAWYAVVIGVPVAALLLWPESGRRRFAGFLLGLALVLAGLGAYAGYAAGEREGLAAADQWFLFGFTTALAWFVALPFAALWIRRGRTGFLYAELFANAWGNGLTLLFAGGFTGLVWGLLALWAGLFDIIGIGFFGELFTRREFAWPATTLAFGLALFLGRRHGAAVATLRKIVLSTGRSLLPLVAFIALLFLLFLPFTGVQPLWDTGHAAALMLVLQFAVILFVNAAWQDGNVEAPFHPWVRRGVTLAVITLPIYSALTLQALYLRVSQHGWTGGRVWAVLVALLAAFHALGYMAGAIARRSRWLAWVGPVNVGMALCLIAVLVAANTPALDPNRIGAESQLDRLLTRRVAVSEFDFGYLRFEAGRYGIEALNRLAEASGDPEAEAIRTAAKNALAQEQRWNRPSAQAAQLMTFVNVFPEGRTVDPAFLQFLAQHEEEADAESCAAPEQDCLFLATDLNQDGRDEYVQFFYPYHVFAREDAGWRKVGRIEAQAAWSTLELRAALERRNFGVARPRWPDLDVGGVRFGIVEEGRGE
jgi:hypothetical protein